MDFLRTDTVAKKLARDYLLLATIPILVFFLCTVIGGLIAKLHVGGLIDTTIHRISADAKSQLVENGETFIRSRAREVARQIDLFLQFHPTTELTALLNDWQFTALAMQPVGSTGYTCLFEAGTGIMLLHPNPALLGKDPRLSLSEYEAFGNLYASSLPAREVSGYYDWRDPDEQVRKKYMTVTPIATRVQGKTLLVAATIYLDEFLAPVQFIEKRQAEASSEYHRYMLSHAELSGGVVAGVLLLALLTVRALTRRAAHRLVRPISMLADAAEEFGKSGAWAVEDPGMLSRRTDEIGVLSRSFNRMRQQIESQFEKLKSNYMKLKETQQALAASEQLYRGLFDNLPIGVYRSTPAGRFLDVNPTMLSIFGFTDKELMLSCEAQSLYAREGDRETFKRLVEGDDAGVHFEVQMLRRDGSPFWVENQARAVRDGDGNAIYYEGSMRDATERKKAEAALRESESNFRLVVENSPIAIFLQAGGRFRYLNSAALKLFGAETKDRLLGQLVLDRIHPDYHQSVKERRRLLEEQKLPVSELERVYLRLDQTPVHVEVSAVPFAFQGQNGVLALVRDISDRRKAETAIRESEARFRTAFENSNVGMCLVALDGTLMEVNAAFAGMIGRTAGEMIGRRVIDFTHPDDLQHRSQFIRSLLEERNPSGVDERRFLHRDGSVVFTQVCASLKLDQGGSPEYFISLVLDITQRKKDEEELQLAHYCVNHAAVGIMRIRDDARILDANNHACRSLGYSRDELVGKTVFDIDPMISEGDWIKHRKSLAASGVRTVERIHRRKDGTEFPVEITINHLKRGEEGFSFSFINDISHRVRDEQEKQKLETQLRQAQKMEAIGTLAGGIAHDFNNILSVIIGNIEILKFENSVRESETGNLEQIDNAADRARQLVRQILAFSRQGEQQRLLVNLRPLIKETFEFLRSTLPTTIELRQKIGADAPLVFADPTQMQQILMNLCTNASHAMERDGGTLTVAVDSYRIDEDEARVEPDAGPGEYVKLSVSDTGHGMEPGVLGRIFDPYFTTKGPGKGTGLGLAVVHGIVSAHGGKIKVHSQIGEGTAFHVFLPKAEGGQKSEPKTLKPLPMGTERILLVDDEAALVDMGKTILERLGYQVVPRTSPLEALEAFRSNPVRFDAVISDMTMPQLTGVGLAKKLLEIRPDIPVILCSGFGDRANEERARSLGVRAFLHKPVGMQDLANELRAALDSAAAGHQQPVE